MTAGNVKKVLKNKQHNTIKKSQNTKKLYQTTARINTALEKFYLTYKLNIVS